VPHYPGISVGSLRHVGGMTRTVSDARCCWMSSPDLMNVIHVRCRRLTSDTRRKSIEALSK